MRKSFAKKVCKNIISLVLAASLVTMTLAIPAAGDSAGEYGLPWLWPVPDSYKINSLDYYYGGDIHGSGACMDIGANGYTGANRLEVVSATNGTVQYIVNKYDENGDRGTGWGNYVIVTSGNTNIVYAHLKTVTCGYGQIKAGDVIGKMGNTGNSTAVHLHIQAYPVKATPNDTSIYVFDKYIDNPLYAPKFEFMKGLEAYSVRYGQHISKNYTRSSGSYYSYTGGSDLDFAVSPVFATVVVINTEGASVRSLPVNDNSFITDTAVFMEKLEISGVYYDAFGKIWIELLESRDGGTFVSYDDVGFYDYGFSVSSNDIVVPSGAYGGYTELPFSGRISSKNIIMTLSAAIKTETKTVAEYTENVMSSSATLGGIYSGLNISTLPDGDYTFELYIKEKAEYPGAGELRKDVLITSSKFSIHSELSDKVPPVIEVLSFDDVTSTGFTAVCRASDNKGIANVTFVLYDSGDNILSTAQGVYQDGAYRYRFANEVVTEDTRNYKVKTTVRDSYENSVSGEKRVILPNITEGELWKASITLKIRNGPGTAYTHISSIQSGSTFRIFDVQRTLEGGTTDGYIWGHHEKGYSPLGDYGATEMYATYVDGNLYTLMFDLNGGSGTAPVSIGKRFNADAVLPASTFTRQGFTFLGWSTDSGSQTAEYLPSSLYSENSDAVLYAVWGDENKPVIDSMTLSTSGWTSGPVVINVTAHDNSDNLLYSFDYGRTWQSSPAFEVFENKTYPSGIIAVRDVSGNITYYEKQISISNIDSTEPDVAGALLDVTPDNGKISFTVSDVFDYESGVSDIVLSYSSDSEFSSETVIDVTNGGSAVLLDGVYYWYLTVTDIAGNSAETKVGRFRVGTPEKLSAPQNTKVLSTGSGSAVLAWDDVVNADKYEVNISKTGTFEDEISAYVRSASFEIKELDAGEIYYFTVSALCDDKVYSESDRSKVNQFLTKSDDSSIHSMKSMTDAEISDKTVSYVAPYEQTSLDITALTEEHATAEYYRNQSLTTVVADPASCLFTTDEMTFYIKVTAENGSYTVYRLDVVRAEEKAAQPTVRYDFSDQNVYVGDEVDDISVYGESTDGGEITVKWYMSYNDGAYAPCGDEFSLSPACADKAGTYKFYAEVTNCNAKCKNKNASATTSTVTVTVSKRVSDIGVYCANLIYNGNTPSPSVFGYLGDGVVLYYYYSDSACTDLIDAPSDAGTYYVKAYAVETDKYLTCTSSAVKFIISKAENTNVPEYNVTDSTLRCRNSYVDVISPNVEYKVSGTTVWTAVGDDALEFPEGTVLELRIKESTNYLSGKPVTVTLDKYSGPFDIVPKELSGASVKADNLYVTGKKNTVSDILSLIENSAEMNVYSADNTAISDETTVVGTGSKIVIEDEEGIFAYLNLVVIGDVDGDGDVTSDDVMTVMSYSNGTKLSESEFDVPAGDINGDGKLTTADAYLIYSMI